VTERSLVDGKMVNMWFQGDVKPTKGQYGVYGVWGRSIGALFSIVIGQTCIALSMVARRKIRR